MGLALVGPDLWAQRAQNGAEGGGPLLPLTPGLRQSHLPSPPALSPRDPAGPSPRQAFLLGVAPPLSYTHAVFEESLNLIK